MIILLRRCGAPNGAFMPGTPPPTRPIPQREQRMPHRYTCTEPRWYVLIAGTNTRPFRTDWTETCPGWGPPSSKPVSTNGLQRISTGRETSLSVGTVPTIPRSFSLRKIPTTCPWLTARPMPTRVPRPLPTCGFPFRTACRYTASFPFSADPATDGIQTASTSRSETIPPCC